MSSFVRNHLTGHSTHSGSPNLSVLNIAICLPFHRSRRTTATSPDVEDHFSPKKRLGEILAQHDQELGGEGLKKGALPFPRCMGLEWAWSLGRAEVSG